MTADIKLEQIRKWNEPWGHSKSSRDCESNETLVAVLRRPFCLCKSLPNRRQNGDYFGSELLFGLWPWKLVHNSCPSFLSADMNYFQGVLHLVALFLLPAGIKIFHDFLKTQYSDENLLFWLAVEQLKKEKEPTAMKQMAQTIYKDYLSSESPKEVSAVSKNCQRFPSRKLQKGAETTYKLCGFQERQKYKRS